MSTIDCSLAPKYTDTPVRKPPAKDQDYWSLIGPISPQTQYGEPGLITNKTIPTGIIKLECALKSRQLVIEGAVLWLQVQTVNQFVTCCSSMFCLLVTLLGLLGSFTAECAALIIIKTTMKMFKSFNRCCCCLHRNDREITINTRAGCPHWSPLNLSWEFLLHSTSEKHCCFLEYKIV